MHQHRFTLRCNISNSFIASFSLFLGVALILIQTSCGLSLNNVRIDLGNKNIKCRKLMLPPLVNRNDDIRQPPAIFQIESSFQKFTSNVFLSLSILSIFFHNPLNAIAFEPSTEITVSPSTVTLSSADNSNDKTYSHPKNINNFNNLWELPNGDVELKSYPFLKNFPQYRLSDPILLGSGGGGAVFSTVSHLDSDNENDNKNGFNSDTNIALKISWIRSSISVEKECQILQELGKTDTRNVEICLGIERYGNDDSGRVAIALQPVFTDEKIVSSVDNMNVDVQAQAVQSIVRTLVDMLSVNVVTTDVQPLMGKETGSVLFIDLTEAQIMGSPEPSFLDVALASSFISEMTALIPESLVQTASNTFLDELTKAHLKGIIFPFSIYELFKDQSSLINFESMKIIDSKIAFYQQQTNIDRKSVV